MLAKNAEGLAAAGRELYGEHWQGPLARDLEVSRETIRRWLNGHTPLGPDHGVFDDLKELLHRRARELGGKIELLRELKANLDGHTIRWPRSGCAEFDRLDARVCRAYVHVHEFAEGWRDFMDRRPFEVERREEGKDWIYVLTKADEMPVSLSLIASGALGHLRAALDNLAYQLVLKSRSGAAPDWRVTFPISSAANKYAERRDGMLKGVDSQVLAVVDALEPYRDGKGKALWQLTELANLDKHRVLIPGRHYHAFVDMAPEFRELTNDYFGSDWPLPIPAIPVKPADGTMELGSVLFRQKENARSPHAEKVEFGFECRIDAPHIVDGESAIRTIVRCADSVRDAVNSFRQFFPS